MKNTALVAQELGVSDRFHPHLQYNESLGCLQVILRDCGMNVREVVVSKPFDILKDCLPKGRQNPIVGFIFWNAKGMLYDQGYTKSSISLEHLIKRFARYHKLPYNTSVFSRYDQYVLHIARTHLFVWHIPK